MDMEAVADLFHASFGVMGQADVMKTSQVSRVNGTTHNHQSSLIKEGASLDMAASSLL